MIPPARWLDTNFRMLKVVFSISSDMTRLVQPIHPMHSQENAPKLQIWLVSLSQIPSKMRKINRPWPKCKQLKMQSGYISMSNCKPFLPCILKKIARTPTFHLFHWVKIMPKREKSTGHGQNFIKFGRWLRYISMPRFRPFLPCFLKKMSGRCKFGLFH